MPLPVLAIPLATTGVKALTSFLSFNSQNNAEKVTDTARVEALNDILFPLHAQLAFTLTGKVRTTVAFPKDGSANGPGLSKIISAEMARQMRPLVVQANRETLASYVRTELSSNFTHVTLVPAVLDMLNQVIARGGTNNTNPLATPISSILGAIGITSGGMAVEETGTGQNLNLASALLPGITTGPALLILGAAVVVFILFLAASKTGRSG